MIKYYDKFKYCPKCGSIEFNSFSNTKNCKNCGFIFFGNPAATVSLILKKGFDILVVTRKNDPFKGMLDLPGGFVDTNETLEEALIREINEELDINISPFPFRYYASFPSSYEFQENVIPTCDTFFLLDYSNLIEQERKLIRKYFEIMSPNDDVQKLEWINIKELYESQFGLESMKKIVSLIKENYYGIR